MVGILLVNTWFHFFLFEAWKLFRAGETQVYPSKPFLSTVFSFSPVYMFDSLSLSTKVSSMRHEFRQEDGSTGERGKFTLYFHRTFYHASIRVSCVGPIRTPIAF